MSENKHMVIYCPVCGTGIKIKSTSETTIKLKHSQLSKVADLVETHIQELKVQKSFNVNNNQIKSIIEYFDMAIKEWKEIRDIIRKELG